MNTIVGSQNTESNALFKPISFKRNEPTYVAQLRNVTAIETVPKVRRKCDRVCRQCFDQDRYARAVRQGMATIAVIPETSSRTFTNLGTAIDIPYASCS